MLGLICNPHVRSVLSPLPLGIEYRLRSRLGTPGKGEEQGTLLDGRRDVDVSKSVPSQLQPQ